MGKGSFGSGIFVHHFPDCDAMFTEILRGTIPRRYRLAVSRRFLLSALGQRQANRPVARMKGYEERETQVYDRSLHRLGPLSH